MSIKKGTAPKVIQTNLTIESMGQTLAMEVTYHNRSRADLQAKIDEGATVAEIVMFLVKEWDCEYPLTKEGLAELESDREGICFAVWQGFSQARAASLVKN